MSKTNTSGTNRECFAIRTNYMENYLLKTSSLSSLGLIQETIPFEMANRHEQQKCLTITTAFCIFYIATTEWHKNIFTYTHTHKHTYAYGDTH